MESPGLPQRFGRYRVLSVAGSGGFATVYKAMDDRLDSHVAIKVLAENWRHDPDIRRRFRDEAVLTRRLTTDRRVTALVQLYDIDETDQGQPYFVMQWAGGGTLADRLGPSRWPASSAGPVVRALAAGLGDLHRAGVVHRDIKPSNLLYCGNPERERAPGELHAPGERLVLADLGLAKDLTEDRSELSLAFGTHNYAAPEQRDPARRTGPATDLFAATRVVARIVGNDDRLESFFATGTSPDPDLRPATAQDWAEGFFAATNAPPRSRSATEAGPTPTVMTPTLAAAAGPRSVASTPTLAAEPRTAHSDDAPRGRPRYVVAVGALIALIALVTVAVGLLGAGNTRSAIVGPDTIVSGEQGEYHLDQVDRPLPWVDPAGNVVLASRLVVIGRLPGTATISVPHNGDTHRRTIEIVESPDGPRIVGPDRVVRGANASWHVEGVDGQLVEWSTPTGDGAVGDAFGLVAQDDTVIQVVATDDVGIVRGSQLKVSVDD